MNQHDRSNLEFLLRANSKTLKTWFESVDQDDIDYAMELLDQYRQELATSKALLKLDSDFEDFEQENGQDCYPEARTVLAKFRLTN